MIKGGDLTSQKLIFDTGYHNAALHLKSVFCGRADFFAVPPFGARVDIEITDHYATFTKHDGELLTYEDTREIIQKAQRFGVIEPEMAQELLHLAQETLTSGATLFFPDERRPTLECSVFFNWVRFTFRGRIFTEVSEKITKDLQNYFPDGITVATNGIDELTLRRDDGVQLLLTHTDIKKLSMVLMSFALIPPELHTRFILNVSQFSVMQSARIFLHETLTNVKETESVGGVIKSTFASDHAMRVLKHLAETGEFDALSEKDTEFLAHVQLFNEKDFTTFSGVRGLKPFMRSFVSAYGPEIRALNDIRLLDKHDVDGHIGGREAAPEIDGNTMEEISPEEKRNRLKEQSKARRIDHNGEG